MFGESMHATKVRDMLRASLRPRTDNGAGTLIGMGEGSVCSRRSWVHCASRCNPRSCLICLKRSPANGAEICLMCLEVFIQTDETRQAVNSLCPTPGVIGPPHPGDGGSSSAHIGGPVDATETSSHPDTPNGTGIIHRSIGPGVV